MPQLHLNPDLDAERLSRVFADKGRIQIRDFLKPQDAEAMVRQIGSLEWNLVMNDRDRHIDLPVSQLEALGLDRIRTAIAQAKARAAEEFQYVYENYPVADAYASGRLTDAGLRAAFEFMNASEIVRFLSHVTGLEVDFCDMQATKYGPGHMLTPHDDGVEGKNRKFAYVLSLTKDWSPVWGGQLQFIEDDNTISDSFVPSFNTLSVFAVPKPHHVSQIASFAPWSRVSLTGWYRTRA